MPKRMLMNAFSMNCVSHIQQGLWVRNDTRQLEYNQLDPWVELAQILEKGCFDALFLADVIGVYDAYRGGAETAIIEGMQTPVNDPAMLVSAMAYSTENLGFAFTSSVFQAHPFTFARQMSTLDHLTKGRVAWNIVTSYLPNAASNFGHEKLPPHEERYDLADEYLEVVYKLWEGSWEEDAVLRDTKRGVYADPAKVHQINHKGMHFDVVGPHLSEPSPQRTPLLFQAGSSTRGRSFAAKHAECVFVVDSRRSLTGLGSVISDVRSQAVRNGRSPEDVLFFQGLSPVVGGTEAEAKAKEAEYLEQFSTEGALAHLSGSIGVDLSSIDLDNPLNTMDIGAMRGSIKGLIESMPDRTQTFRDLIRTRNAGQFLTGAP
ncbi:MAG: NtaA/DmoA family FMN-dependent monooxygenase, partial [Chloroflexota bacterium]|nr:NtaA/DmoA family FMN-dependent monooxygenase [Chloroflexota bacterium]